MVMVIEANTIRNLRDVDSAQFEQVGSLLHTHVADELTGCYTRHLLHFAMEMGTTESYLISQRLYIIFGIGEVLMDTIDNPFHQHFVVAFHLFLPDHLVDLRLCCRLAFDTSQCADQIVDRQPQFFHIEWLGKIGISTMAQTCDPVVNGTLGRE